MTNILVCKRSYNNFMSFLFVYENKFSRDWQLHHMTTARVGHRDSVDLGGYDIHGSDKPNADS